MGDGGAASAPGADVLFCANAFSGVTLLFRSGSFRLVAGRRFPGRPNEQLPALPVSSAGCCGPGRAQRLERAPMPPPASRLGRCAGSIVAPASDRSRPEDPDTVCRSRAPQSRAACPSGRNKAWQRRPRRPAQRHPQPSTRSEVAAQLRDRGAGNLKVGVVTRRRSCTTGGGGPGGAGACRLCRRPASVQAAPDGG